MTPFHPLVLRLGTLSGFQMYLLRVVLGRAGKTILHRDRLVEITDTHTALRQLYPLIESDLSESTAKPFWIPRRQSDRKRFNIERRDKSRRHQTLGVVGGEPRPKYARGQNLRSRFPGHSFLHHLVANLGYDPDAALAAFAGPWPIHGRPDRRRKIAVGGGDDQAERTEQNREKERIRNKRPIRDYQYFNYGDNLYIATAPTRRTLTGGGFTEAQVLQGLSKMRCSREMKNALLQVVYKRESAQQVAEKYGFSRAKLDVYASRLRGHETAVDQTWRPP